MFFSRAQTKAKSAERAAQSTRVKDLVRTAFALGDEDAVSVTEIACPDPGCPDTETAILLMLDGQPTRALKLAKPLVAVTEADVLALARDDEAERAGGSG